MNSQEHSLKSSKQIRIQQSQSSSESVSQPLSHSPPQAKPDNHRDTQHEQQQHENQNSNPKSKSKQKSKSGLYHKRYDYLNKYSQHQLLGKLYEQNVGYDDQFPIQRKPLWDRIQEKNVQVIKNIADAQRNRMQVGKSKPHASVSLGRKVQLQRSYSKSSQRSNRHKRNQSPAHNHYLKAYQQNIPIQAQPLLYQTVPISRPAPASLLPLQTSGELQKILSKIPIQSNTLSSQLHHQNEIYRSQINEYRTLIAKLQIDLTNCREQLLISQNSFMNQKLCYEGIIKELRDQIIKLRGYQDRYQILNEEIMRINQQRINQEIYAYQQENRIMNFVDQNTSQNRELSKGKIKKVQRQVVNNHQQINQSIQKNIFQRIEFILNNTEQTPKSGSLRLSAFSQQILQRVSKIVSKTRKYEEFITSIKQMYRKIEKNIENQSQNRNRKDIGDPTIRQLWKWLKMLGSNYSFMMEIKPILGKKIGFTELETKDKDIKEIMQIFIIKY